MDRHVLVIGAGQAGLAAGYYLRAAGVLFTIVDATRRVGDSWRARYDSLTLFTSRQFSSLPGMGLSGNRELYPDRDEFADYLEAYASRFKLPVRLGAHVVRLAVSDDQTFFAELADGETITASEVIVATGPFQRALVPEVMERFGSKVLQLTTETYRNPNQLPDGPVLIVGDGASGRDIAAECRQRQPVILATGKPRRLLPERLLGKSIWWWLNLTGVLWASPDSWVGQKLQRTDTFPDRGRSIDSLAEQQIKIVPRLTDAWCAEARFADGSTAAVRTVIWAVGYHDDSTWLDVPGAKGPQGAFLHNSGASPVRGIYFVGRPWQRSRASALVLGAGPDAEFIVRRLLSDRKQGVP